VPLSLAAEIQHRLLPGAFTCEAGQFTLAAWLQPAGEIGGDTFDFSLERDTLHVSLTDAMGHTMDAALLATVLVGGLRNARRRGVELAEQARLANDALAEQAGESQFVTGLLVRIDLARATAGIINAGHPPPLRLRAGQFERVHLEADRPFGLQAGGGYRVQPLPLAVGDRLIFVTDGMLERDAAGMNIAAILTEGAGMHPREAVQHLTQAVLQASGGPTAGRRHGAVSRLARRPSPRPRRDFGSKPRGDSTKQRRPERAGGRAHRTVRVPGPHQGDARDLPSSFAAGGRRFDPVTAH
jgi:serine phosphatase RsbU (regulator of sigma subunit)